MKIEKFTIENVMQMDSMHDAFVSIMEIDNNCLKVVYEDLDKQLLNPDKTLVYNNKRLEITYDIISFCDAKISYGKNKCKYINILEEKDIFNEYIKSNKLTSYQYSLDSFNQLTLSFDLHNFKKNKMFNNKCWQLEIKMNFKSITFNWE